MGRPTQKPGLQQLHHELASSDLTRAAWYTQQAVPWRCDGGDLLLTESSQIMPTQAATSPVSELQKCPKLLSKPEPQKGTQLKLK